jgi:hypothetical protein
LHDSGVTLQQLALVDQHTLRDWNIGCCS